MSKINKLSSGICAFFFYAIIIIGFIFSICSAVEHIKGVLIGLYVGSIAIDDAPTTFEEYYDSTFSKQEWSIDVFSLVQRALGKHETRNFEVIKAKDGKLYLQNAVWPTDKETLDIIINEYQMLYEETRSYGGRFIFVQVPYKNSENVEELKYYTLDGTETAENYIVASMRGRGIPVFDLREYKECCEMYNTDHHWTVRSAFYSSALIAKEIERLYHMELIGSEYFGDISNYENLTYTNSFLGSIGIKVGPYFTGKDDFTVYKPNFDTSYEFEHYVGHNLEAKYSGDFWETFIDQSKLDDEEFNNKFLALMQGAFEELVVRNYNANNNYKGLVVSHSYSRPVMQYLSLNFAELRNLDPQKGRYNDDYLEYVREYRPDVVIVMYDSLLNVGDGYWTED